MPRSERRETSPAGNTITHCSAANASSTACRLPRWALPPRMRTGNSRSCSGAIAPRRSLATIRTSRRMRPTASSRASASSAPDGWLATISKRPVAGIFANAAGSTWYWPSMNSSPAATKPNPRNPALRCRNASIWSNRDQRPTLRSNGRASWPRRPWNQSGKRCWRRCSSSCMADPLMPGGRIGRQPAPGRRQPDGGFGAER